MRPIDAVEMTGIVLTEPTITVDLRHFFVPREVVPRTMSAKMLPFHYNDNPVNVVFCSGLTDRAE